MKIKNMGQNSSNKMKLIKNLERCLKNNEIQADVEDSQNQKDLDKYNVSNTPAFIINDKVISQGKVLTEKEIKKYIQILN